MSRGKDRIRSHAAGYHRGLNTEYHDWKPDIWLYPLFLQWLKEESNDRRYVFEPDFWSFEEGYREGIRDYEKVAKENEE
tara:strand:- start:249 stop:485 length:237 start_codon:yes stop_codon:yes gene_type:complete